MKKTIYVTLMKTDYRRVGIIAVVSVVKPKICFEIK